MSVKTMETSTLKDLAQGSARLAALLSPNFGPSGRNTIFDQLTDIELVVNDGRQILPQLELAEKEENTGATLLKNAGIAVGQNNGDGTTATILMADALVQEGMKQITAGTNPIQLKKELDRLSEPVLDAIRAQAAAPDKQMLEQVAVIAADDEEIGHFAAEAYEAVRPDGQITVVDSQEPHTRIEMFEGVRYEYGIYNQGFITDQVRRQAVLDDPYILLLNQKVSAIDDLKKMIMEAAEKKVSLLIIAQDVDQPLLNVLLMNNANRALKCCVGKGPGFGDTRRRNLECLAAKTGAVMIEENCGLTLKDCGLEVCGRAGRAVLDKDSTLLEGLPNENPERVAQLIRRTKETLENEKSPDEQEKLQETLNILSGKSAKIICGGMVEYEMFEQKSKADSAVAAIRAAERGGIVPGGGTVLLHALRALPETGEGEVRKAAVKCLNSALLRPVLAIAENAGYSGDVVVEKVSAALAGGDKNYGFDAQKGEYGDMIAAGVLDCTDTICEAVRTAVSIAGIVLTAGAVVYPPENKEQ